MNLGANQVIEESVEEKEKLIRVLVELAEKNRISLSNHIEDGKLNLKSIIETLHLVHVVPDSYYKQLLFLIE